MLGIEIEKTITAISGKALHQECNIANYLSTEPSTKSMVPRIAIRSANRWLWLITFKACKL